MARLGGYKVPSGTSVKPGKELNGERQGGGENLAARRGWGASAPGAHASCSCARAAFPRGRTIRSRALRGKKRTGGLLAQAARNQTQGVEARFARGTAH